MFYNFGPGGDGTLNPNWAMYPQRALVIGEDTNTVLSAGATPLMPAEHMSESTYNIWNRINFGAERIASNLATREFLKRLYASGANIAVGDILGVVTLPRLAILRGVMLQVNSPNEGVIFDVISLATGQVLIAGVDGSIPGVYYVDVAGFVVAPDSNDSIALRVTSWPALETDDVDPCGIYGPCDDLTLCITLNAFIWTPVSAEFCRNDPCFGANLRIPMAVGTVVATREAVVVDEVEVANPADVANTVFDFEDDGAGAGPVTVNVRDSANDSVAGVQVYFQVTGTGNATVSPNPAISGADGAATATVTGTTNEAPNTITIHLGAPNGPVVGEFTPANAV